MGSLLMKVETPEVDKQSAAASRKKYAAVCRTCATLCGCVERTQPVTITSSVRLRTRLVSLGLLATAPALIVILYTQSLERERARERAEADIRQLTTLVASQQATVFDGVQRLLLTLVQLPELQSRNPDRCRALLPIVLRDHPGYINLWVDRPWDLSFCEAIPVDRKLTSAHPTRVWYQRAVATRATAVGDFQVSPITGMPDVIIAQPLVMPSGEVDGVVAVAISLQPIDDIAARAQLPAGTTLTMLDRRRRVLARYPGDQTWVGRIMPEPSPASLYAAAPVRGTLDTGLQFTMEVDPGAAMAQANSLLRRQAVLLGLLLLAAAAVSLIGGERFVRRPIAELTGVTTRLAAGDLSARATMHGSAPGVDDLATAINTMAKEMEARSRAEARAQAELRASEE